MGSLKTILVALLSISIAFAQPSKSGKDKLKPLDSLVKDKTQEVGMITTYSKENELWFEIPDSLLGKDLMMVTRFVQLPSNYQAYINAGSKTAQQMIHFQKKENQLLITQQSDVNFANENDPIALSVAQNNFPPILAAFPIKNSDQDRYLIDVSSYFQNDSPGFNIIQKSIKKICSMGNKKQYDVCCWCYPC